MPVTLSDEQARTLARWAEAETTAWGPAFDGALSVAQAVAKEMGPRAFEQDLSNPYQELRYLVAKINEVYSEKYDEREFHEDEEWGVKYDIIFSDQLSRRIRELMGPLDYYDPDTSYYEDVQAYVTALNDEWKRKQKVLEARYG
jgi:hypothetical protein